MNFFENTRKPQGFGGKLMAKMMNSGCLLYTSFSFCAEGLTGTRRTQNQTIWVFQQLSVHHNEVVGQSIDAVVQSFFPVLEQFLRSEGHKDSCGTGGQSSRCV